MRDKVVLFDIRAPPRSLMGALVGASLAVSGAVMQGGLFRNPLADPPGIVGISAGGAGGLGGAIIAIVLGGMLPVVITDLIGFYIVPVFAFIGAWAATLLLYRVSTRKGGRTSVATMLLAGIALGALAGALSGILIYIADDAQLRDLTFWGGMGSLAGGATWMKFLAAAPLMGGLGLVVAPFLARGLNGLALGEAAAATWVSKFSGQRTWPS